MANELLNILSLGAGVQSTTVLLMSCLGELPKLDCAIFADTGWEPKEVYSHLVWLEKYAATCGIPVHRVAAGNIKEDALNNQVRGQKGDGNRWASMPFRTLSPEGEQGIIRRQCTGEYKIEPIEKFIKTEVLGLKKHDRWPKHPVARRWYGISADETYRLSRPINRSGKPMRWAINYYPLVGMEFLGDGDRRVEPALWRNRAGCLEWLESKGFPRPPRSACIGCPFKSNEEWRHLRDTSPAEWQDAIEFDRAVRNCVGMRGQIFLHRDYVPLEIADISSEFDNGQGDLFGCESGHCFT